MFRDFDNRQIIFIQKKMQDLLFIRTETKDYKKLEINRKFYKALGMDYVIISPFDKVDEEEIEKILALNESYKDFSLGLVLSFDIKNLMARLLGTKAEFIDFSDPKIRKSLYHFISYLIKHGLSAFEFLDLDSLSKNEIELIESVRELNKNTFFNKDILAMTEISLPRKNLMALANPNLSTLSLVRSKKEMEDIFAFATDFLGANAGLCLGDENFPQDTINFKNYPIYGKRLVFMVLFFLKASLYLEESNLDFEDIIFLRKLFAIKDQVKNLDRIQKILPREKEILAFIGYKEGKKILFLSNLTEKEVLVDLAYKVLDYKDYEFLFGSITKRKLYRTVLLRPYEALAFINCN